MNYRKNMVLPAFLGLLLTAFAIGVAQEPAQTTQTKQSENCCAVDSCPMKDSGSTAASDSCCCSGDSCDLKKHEGERKNHDCCCSGESCDMKAKHEMKNHSGDASCCANCGKAKHNSKTKQKTN